MNISRLIAQAGQYLSEAILRIFSPDQDIYPVIGTQAFEGDPCKESSNSW
ncbi:MAG: nicotinate phosphoribosyltransferase [Coleofasciculaceae cyanobacterium SM2_1_6]|nr:nicotinate phosphoribosyltransferase [Coleofasciculaceae cyanobacterium SM2_1_6]